MYYEQFKKHLKKCSFDSICMYLYNDMSRRSALRDIEFIEYNTKSQEYLNQAKEFNDKNREMDLSEPESYIEFMKRLEEWKKVQGKLDRLNKWFSEGREREE